MEPRLLRHAYESNGKCKRITQVDLRNEAIFVGIRTGRLTAIAGDICIYKIKEVLCMKNEDEVDNSLEILEEIERSPPDSWWHIPPLDFKPDEMDEIQDEHEGSWILVNYQQKKLYIGPDATVCYRWTDNEFRSLWGEEQEVQ